MYLLRLGIGLEGARQILLLQTALSHVTTVPHQGVLATLLFSRPKRTSSLGSGFDGSSFSDDEDNPYDEARKSRFGDGEPGRVTLRGHEIDLMVDEFNKQELQIVFGGVPSSAMGTSPGLKADEPNALVFDGPADGSRATTMDTRRRDYGCLTSMGTPREMFSVPFKMGADDDVAMRKHQSSQRSVNDALGLSHIDSAGKAAMVNVAPKADVQRVAMASGRVLLGADAFSLVAANNLCRDYGRQADSQIDSSVSPSDVERC